MKSRPMSATTATSFGQSTVKKNLEMNPKVSHYHSNGSGRDGYIKLSNGGFRKTWENNFTNILSQKISRGDVIKSTKIQSKVVIYKNMGCGRDSYISTSCGGFFKTSDAMNFPTVLRQYEVKSQPKKNDFLFYSKVFLKPEEKKFFNTLSHKQRAQSARLSKPKEFR